MNDPLGIRATFPPPALDAWQALVTRDLKGAPFDKKLVTPTDSGLDLQPLYTAADWDSASDASGFPGLWNLTRGTHALPSARRGWVLASELTLGDPSAAGAALEVDLARGVEGVDLVFDAAFRSARAPDDPQVGTDGVAAWDLDGLEAALAPVGESTSVHLQPGAAFDAGAALLAALWERRGFDPTRVSGSFGADPCGSLARGGRLPGGLDAAFDRLAALTQWSVERYASVRAIEIGGDVYHDAGASDAQELAFAIANALDLLRALDERDLEPFTVADELSFRLSMDCDFVLGVAKLRAFRRIWARVCSNIDVMSREAPIHVRTARRVTTRRDPWVNLLRGTVAAFCAAVGGADRITVGPFDGAVGPSDALARRLARNTQLILREEVHAGHVIDPAGGSYAFERLSEELAQSAWSIFQTIEGQGGFRQALTSGWVSESIQAQRRERAARIAKRKQPLTGVSEFPALDEERLVRPPADLASLRRAPQPLEGDPPADPAASLASAMDGANAWQLTSAWRSAPGQGIDVPLTLKRLSEPYEALRGRSDAALAKAGRRPQAFLASMGPLPKHTARSAWVAALLAAGGIEALTSDGYASPEEAAEALRSNGAKLAVVSAPDDDYPALLPSLLPALAAAGAKRVFVAGHPRDQRTAYEAAGAHGFVHVGVDVLAFLGKCWEVLA